MVQLQNLCLYICLPDLNTVTGDHGDKCISVKRCDSLFTVTVSSFSYLYSDHILRRKNNASCIQCVCGAMGVMIVMAALGDTIGPPADRLYPVDPVGVEIIIPSAL